MAEGGRRRWWGGGGGWCSGYSVYQSLPPLNPMALDPHPAHLGTGRKRGREGDGYAEGEDGNE